MNKINVMHSLLAKSFNFLISKSNIDTQKLDYISLETFIMIIALFEVIKKEEKF